MILAKDYVISGLKKKTGERVYAAIDHHSGGYLYWTTSLSQAARYSEPKLPTDSYLKNDVDEIVVLEVTSTAEIIRGDDLINIARKKAADKIAAIQEELQKELDQLAKL